MFRNKEDFKKEFERRIIEKYGRGVSDSHITEKYDVLGTMVRDYASVNWKTSKDAIRRDNQRQVIYFSLEFLIGRLLVNNMQNMGIYEVAKEALNELADSIRENGVFQPIIVKKSIKGYDVIAGERRLRASKIAGRKTIPAIIRQLSDDKMAEIALLENLQRENLNALEEAKAYKALIEKLDITQDELAKRVSKSRSHVTNTIGILRLPVEVQNMIVSGELTMGHARVLSKLSDDEEIIKMAKEIVNEKMPVRDLEKVSTKAPRKVAQNNEYNYVEELLADKLGTKVKINDYKLVISFTNTADLNRILEILNVKE